MLHEGDDVQLWAAVKVIVGVAMVKVMIMEIYEQFDDVFIFWQVIGDAEELIFFLI